MIKSSRYRRIRKRRRYGPIARGSPRAEGQKEGTRRRFFRLPRRSLVAGKQCRRTRPPSRRRWTAQPACPSRPCGSVSARRSEAGSGAFGATEAKRRTSPRSASRALAGAPRALNRRDQYRRRGRRASSAVRRRKHPKRPNSIIAGGTGRGEPRANMIAILDFRRKTQVFELGPVCGLHYRYQRPGASSRGSYWCSDGTGFRSV